MHSDRGRCPTLNTTTLSTQVARLHHYQSQSVEHQQRRSAAGESNLHSRVRNAHYWKALELRINKVRDTELADKAVCASGHKVSRHTSSELSF